MAINTLQHISVKIRGIFGENTRSIPFRAGIEVVIPSSAVHLRDKPENLKR